MGLFTTDPVWWCLFGGVLLLWLSARPIRSFLIRATLFVRLGRINNSRDNFSRVDLPAATAALPRVAALRAQLAERGFHNVGTLSVQSGSLGMLNDAWVSADGMSLGIIAVARRPHRPLFAFTSFLPSHYTVQTSDHAGGGELSGMSERQFFHEMPLPALLDEHLRFIAGRNIHPFSGDLLERLVALNEARWRRCVELELMKETARGYRLTFRAKWLMVTKRHTQAVREGIRQIRERRQTELVPATQPWGPVGTDSTATPVLQYSTPSRVPPVVKQLRNVAGIFSWLLVLEIFFGLTSAYSLYGFWSFWRTNAMELDAWDWPLEIIFTVVPCAMSLVAAAFMTWARRLLIRRESSARKTLAVSITASILGILSLHLGLFWLLAIGSGIYALAILLQPETRQYLKAREQGLLDVTPP